MDGQASDRKGRAGLSGRHRLLFAAGMLSVFPHALHAQQVTSPAVPPTREELEIGQARPAGPDERNRLVVEGDVERGPCPLADPAFADTTVTMSRVEFRNLEAVPAAALDPAWRDMSGREMPVASLCEIRDRAATMLRRMGYLAAVQIPPQRIDDSGVVQMDVLVARLVEVQVRGNPGPSERLIADHLGKLTDQRWFNVQQAERHLLLLSDLPGYEVRLTLKPAKGAPGDVVGDVLVKRRPVEFSLGMQNLGSKATGREGVFAQLVLNDLIGLGDRTAFSIFNTVDVEEQTVLQLSHDLALGTNGLRMRGSLLYARGEPGFGGGNFETKTLLGRLELSYPVVRRRALSLYAAGGFEAIDQSIDLGSIALSEDDLRIFYGRMDLDVVDSASLYGRGGYTASEPRWRVLASVEARQGISGLGASKDCTPLADCLAPNVPISNLLADPTAFVLRGQAVMEYRPAPVVTVALAPRFQYSGDTLLSFEQYSLGNYTIGRGLDPGLVQGDSGVGSSIELRYGRQMPRSPDAVALQPFVFLDAAWAWNNDGGVSDDPRKVFTAGGGVRARWGNRMDANLILAAPLRRAGFQTERGDVRLLFTIRARLVPWGPS